MSIKKHTKKVLFNCAILFCLSIATYNCFNEKKILLNNVTDGFVNLDNNRPFFNDRGNSMEMLELAQKNIPTGSKVYFWSFSDPRMEIATQSRVMELNYVLHPITVCYGNDAFLADSYFILCHSALLPDLKRKLIEIELLKECELDFNELDRSGKTVILHRD